MSTLRLLLLLWLVLQPRPVRADAAPKLPRRAFYVSPGVTFGGSHAFDLGTHAVLGGEVSAFFWTSGRRVLWGGLFTEGLYDWSRGGARLTVGPELGWGPLGLDGGYLADFSEGGPHHGGAVRLCLSLGVVGLFVRYGAVRDAPDFVDFGLFLKAPIAVYQEYRQRPVAPAAPASGPAPTTRPGPAD